MPDPMPQAPPAGAAEAAVKRLEELAAGLRGCCLLDASGAVLAASAEDREAWGEAARGLLAAADAAAAERAGQVHVATEDGEAFALREGGLAIVAVAERFVLASLLFADMRAVLRELRAGPG